MTWRQGEDILFIMYQLVQTKRGLGQLGLTCGGIQALYARYSGRHDVCIYLTDQLLMMSCSLSTFQQ